jgi:hypothetical protein
LNSTLSDREGGGDPGDEDAKTWGQRAGSIKIRFSYFPAIYQTYNTVKHNLLFVFSLTILTITITMTPT